MGLSTAIVLACVLVAADAILVAEVVHRRAEPDRPDYGWRALGAGALSAVVAMAAASLVLDAVVGFDLFGWAHVLYGAVTVMVPLAGAALVVRCWGARWRLGVRTPGWAAALGLVALVPGAVGAWSSFVAPFDLQVDRVEVVTGPGCRGCEPVRIGVISDIQADTIGAHERDAVAAMVAEAPDIIVVAGDHVQGSRSRWESQVEPLRELLSGLSAPGGVFVVPGNVDEPDLLRRAVGGTSATYLENDIVTTTVHGRDVTIGGIEFFYARDAPRRTIAALEARPGDDDLRILLAHHPDAVTALAPGSPIDLVAAGHSHGGQVSFPVVGLLFTATERIPEAVAAGGLHTVGGHRVYVSTGVGMERGQAPQVRFGVPASIGVLSVT